jgi:hypothetical protein
MKPGCDVLKPMMQMITLFTAARTHPCHIRRPTRIVEITVNKHEM